MKDILKLLIFVLIYTKITSPLLSDHITVNLDTEKRKNLDSDLEINTKYIIYPSHFIDIECLNLIKQSL